MSVHGERELLEQLAANLERAAEAGRLLTVAQAHRRLRVDSVELALAVRRWRELAAQARATLADPDADVPGFHGLGREG